MFKFNVGKKVRQKCGSSFSNGKKEVTVARVDEFGCVWFKETGTQLYAFRLEPVEPDGPIRTVSRREIVPGVYGKVCVNEKGDGTGLDYIQVLPSLDATELREAAHILNQLAEALEDA